MKILLPIICVLLVQQWAIAQNNVSFDQLSFNEPANWTFADNGSYHTYLNKNYTSNIFCIISVYASDVSSGNPEQDFQNEWKGIVSGHFTVQKNPSPQQNKSAGGISYLQDEAAVSNSNGNYFARLSVFNLKGKVQSILFLTGNKNSLTQYQADLDRFLASLKPNNIENTNTTNTSTLTNTSPVTSTNSGLIHFNHFLFTAPAGWNAQQNGTVMTLTAPVQAADRMLTIILLPSSSDTGFLNAGNNAISLVATSIGGKATESPVVGHPFYSMLHDGMYGNSWPYSYGLGEIDISQRNANNLYAPDLTFAVGVYLVKIHNRIERMLFLSKDYKCGIYTATTYFTKTYQQVIDEFFFDMRYDDSGEPILKQGKIASSGITGVWTGVSYLGTNGVKYDNTFFILFDNGQVCYDSHFPKRGLFHVNTLAEAAGRPDLWGTYTYQNGSGIMKISSWRTIPFTLKDGKLMTGTGGSTRPFAKIPLIDKATLNGTWCLNNSCISFTPDGKFIDHGVIYQLEHLPSTCDFTEPNDAQGTYEIKDNSIFFHYSDGVTVQNAITGVTMENGNLSTQQLSLGWYNDIMGKK